MTARQLTHKCNACTQPVRWVISERGRRVAINPDPVIGGNVHLTGTPPVALVLDRHALGTIDLFDPDDDGIRYAKHDTTCPAATS